MTQSTAVTTPAVAPPAKANITTGGALSALVPKTLDETFRLAKALAGSGDMIPKAFQNNEPATMAAIIKGMEIGLAPMQALSSIAVINGRASLWGDAMPALMQRAGHHVDVELTGEGDALTATATLTRGDTGRVIVRRFSMADAKKAQLAGKPGPWQQYPGRMLSARARSYAIRDGAADALMGLQLAEEVQDYGPDAARDVTPVQAAPRRGGVVYADPDPVDEIHEAVLEDAPTPAQIAAAAEATARDLAARDGAVTAHDWDEKQ